MSDFVGFDLYPNLKEFLEKVDFEKDQQTTNTNQEKSPSTSTETSRADKGADHTVSQRGCAGCFVPSTKFLTTRPIESLPCDN